MFPPFEIVSVDILPVPFLSTGMNYAGLSQIPCFLICSLYYYGKKLFNRSTTTRYFSINKTEFFIKEYGLYFRILNVPVKISMRRKHNLI